MKYPFLATVLMALIVTFLAYNKPTAESILILKPMADYHPRLACSREIVGQKGQRGHLTYTDNTLISCYLKLNVREERSS